MIAPGSCDAHCTGDLIPGNEILKKTISCDGQCRSGERPLYLGIN